MNNELIHKLGGIGEKLCQENVSSNEEIGIKLQGAFGEAIIATNKALYILKWGFMAGNFLGGRCIAFPYKNITSIEIKKSLTYNTFEVVSPGTQNAQKSYWGAGNNNAIEADNVVTFHDNKRQFFQQATNIVRELMHQAHFGKNVNSLENQDLVTKLKELKEMFQEKIISKQEFEKAKRKLLD